MIDHTQRLTGVVKGALKEAAMGEAVGYAVSFGYWPQTDQTGNVVGMGPAWFVFVSIRNGLDPEPIGNGFPVHGLLPPDDAFVQVARGLLERCRQERDAKSAQISESLKGMDLKGLIK